MFGRLVAYCAAADGSLKPDTLLAIQFASVGTINYAPLLAATTANAAATAAAALAPALTARAPAQRGLGAIAQRIALEARDARRDTLPWSAAFVVTCVRGAGMSLGLETIVGVGRGHAGARAAAAPVVRARGVHEGGAPAPRGSPPRHVSRVHAGRARTAARGHHRPRPPGDDCGGCRHAGGPRLAEDTHGDIVIDVDRQRRHVETVGGNLSDGYR